MAGHIDTIFSDFDGTVTIGDVTDLILSRLADSSWLDIEAQWERGEITAKECMFRQIPLIRGGWNAVKEALDDVSLDPEFKSFVRWWRDKGKKVVIVSDGLDRIIHHLFKREGIAVDDVYASILHESKEGKLFLEFPVLPAYPNCTSGICRCHVLRNRDHFGLKVIVGDGMSDYCWAPEADIVFAKSRLLDHCRVNNIPCCRIRDYGDVKKVMREVLQGMDIGRIAGSFKHQD